MADLANAVHWQAISGGHLSYNFFGNKDNANILKESMLKKMFTANLPETEDAQFLFTKLQKYPQFRKSLACVSSANAYKYGSRAFGQKNLGTKKNYDNCQGSKIK